MSRPGQSTPLWKAWLLLALGLWAFLVPSWALPAYNANGSLERVKYANGVEHRYGYDTLNRLRGLSVSRVGGQGGPAAATLYHDYEYKLRASGHREHVVVAGRTTTYTYDELYRLTGEQVVGASAGQGPDRNISYDLDKAGGPFL